MAFVPLILEGNKMIGPGTAGTLVGVDSQVIDFRVVAKRSTAEIPATYGADMSFAAANAQYELQIRYLEDTDATALTMIFWTAIADATGHINFSGTMRDGPISATNPAWAGIAVVTEMGIGGTAHTTGISTVTFPLVARPTLDITP